MTESLTQCDRCNSPVTDSIEIEIENHGRVKFGKRTNDSWICDDCLSEGAADERSFDTKNNNKQHEHIQDASESDVSPNTPPADEADL
ncbi:MAG: hypothetical protein WBX01_09825 [Nitrososphaeraceae archaeon]|jgi:hypothetical protein